MEPNKKSKMKLKSIFAASSFLFLTACGCFPEPPQIEVRQILERFDKCKVYKVGYNRTMDLTFDRNISIEECLAEGNFVITDAELGKIRATYKEAKECYSDSKCKKRR